MAFNQPVTCKQFEEVLCSKCKLKELEGEDLCSILRKIDNRKIELSQDVNEWAFDYKIGPMCTFYMAKDKYQ